MDFMEQGRAQSLCSAPLDIQPDEFRALGHQLVDRIADFFASIPTRRVAPQQTVEAVRTALGNSSLPEYGTEAEHVLAAAAGLLFDHSIISGHPRFWGYVSPPAAPIAVLGDLLAAAVNPNLIAWAVSPIATEIEIQSVRWLAELIGYPSDCGGLMVSGGNMANFIGLLVARRVHAPWDLRHAGMLASAGRRLRMYTSRETHTWIEKAADLFGFGTDSVRWIASDSQYRMDTDALRKQIQADRAQGDLPFLVVGTAGTVSTGAIDPLPELAAICREEGLWFHVDGAYGAAAAMVPDAPRSLQGLREADSVAIDPHKWLYMPLDAGCVLVRDATALQDTFSYRPPYYHTFTERDNTEPHNFFEYGPENSRGFRALKVWLALQQVGREAYLQMISENIRLAQALYRRLAAQPDLQPFSCGLSIATFRYLPHDLSPGSAQVEAYLNKLNLELLKRLQSSGIAYLSNATLREAFVLRACIVNFRTTVEDIELVVDLVARLGSEVDAALRPHELRNAQSDLRMRLDAFVA